MSNEKTSWLDAPRNRMTPLDRIAFCASLVSAVISGLSLWVASDGLHPLLQWGGSALAGLGVFVAMHMVATRNIASVAVGLTIVFVTANFDHMGWVTWWSFFEIRAEHQRELAAWRAGLEDEISPVSIAEARVDELRESKEKAEQSVGAAEARLATILAQLREAQAPAQPDVESLAPFSPAELPPQPARLAALDDRLREIADEQRCEEIGCEGQGSGRGDRWDALEKERQTILSQRDALREIWQAERSQIEAENAANRAAYEEQLASITAANEQTRSAYQEQIDALADQRARLEAQRVSAEAAIAEARAIVRGLDPQIAAATETLKAAKIAELKAREPQLMPFAEQLQRAKAKSAGYTYGDSASDDARNWFLSLLLVLSINGAALLYKLRRDDLEIDFSQWAAVAIYRATMREVRRFYDPDREKRVRQATRARAARAVRRARSLYAERARAAERAAEARVEALILRGERELMEKDEVIEHMREKIRTHAMSPTLTALIEDKTSKDRLMDQTAKAMERLKQLRNGSAPATPKLAPGHDAVIEGDQDETAQPDPQT